MKERMDKIDEQIMNDLHYIPEESDTQSHYDFEDKEIGMRRALMKE